MFVRLPTGRRLWAHTAGTGPPLVLISGAGSPGVDQAPLIEPTLRTFATVITYDRAGLGRSERGRRRATVEDMAVDLRDLLDVLVPGQRVVLVGHSLGGVIAAYFAASFPDRVSGVVIIDSAFDDQDLIPKQLDRAVGIMRVLSYVPGLSKPLLRRAAKAQMSDDISPEAVAALESVMLADTRILRWNAAELATLRESFRLTDAVVRERGLPRVPFTVVTASHHRSAHAKDDQQERVIASQQRLADLAGGQLIMAERSGHLVTFEQPELVIDAVRAVVASSLHGTACGDEM